MFSFCSKTCKTVIKNNFSKPSCKLTKTSRTLNNETYHKDSQQGRIYSFNNVLTDGPFWCSHKNVMCVVGELHFQKCTEQFAYKENNNNPKTRFPQPCRPNQQVPVTNNNKVYVDSLQSLGMSSSLSASTLWELLRMLQVISNH